MTSDDPTNRDSMVKDRDLRAIQHGDETLARATLATDTSTTQTSTTATSTTAISTTEASASGASMSLLVVIEDDPDVQFLVEAIFAMDPRFNVLQVAESAEEALAAPPTSAPGVIVLDHGLAGPLPGLAAAGLLKEKHPQAKIILFTAHAALQARADKDPAIDAFLLKTESERLLPLAQELTGLGVPGQPT
jgi:CheY-like chemotaxis protein